MKGLQGETAGQLTNIPGVKSNQLDDIFNITGNLVTKEVGSQLLGGNASGLMSLFSNNQNNSSADQMQRSLESGITSKLSSQLGMDRSIANKVVAVILPVILSKVTGENSKTPDDDLSPLKNIFGGGNKNDLGGMLNKLF